MKIRMSKTYVVYELYDTIEINKEDYPELIDLTDEDNEALMLTMIGMIKWHLKMTTQLS